jgi:hypothetical protein
MRTRCCLGVGFLGVLLAAAAAPAAEPADRPQDLILAVDVSFSMTEAFESRGRMVPASDADGIRWDGLRFVLDVARPQDRIALVLFRGEAVVVSQFIDPSGFVELSRSYDRFKGKSGRALLEGVLTEIQQKDQEAVKKKERNEEYVLDSLGGVKVEMWPGTSTKLTLDTIRDKGLLAAVDPGKRPTWVLVFTDGVDEKPFARDDDPRYRASRHGRKRSDFDYIDQLAAKDSAALNALAGQWVKDYRERQVPVFTFGLGSECHLPFLQAISDNSHPASPDSRSAASYNPQTSSELLEVLQQVRWELRQHWVVPVLPVRHRPEQEVFRTSEVGIWQDLGVLLYRNRLRGGQAEGQAWAPLRKDVAVPRLVPAEGAAVEVPDLEPRTSRSHWYYACSTDEPRWQGRLEWTINHQTADDSNYQSKCVAAVRTRQPLFAYREPRQGARYTPKDAIPLEVEFTPHAVNLRDGKETVPFAAEDFQVMARVFPLAAPRDVRELTLALLPLEESGPAAKAIRLAPPEKAVRRFRTELVLDTDPESKGKPELLGRYAVDVTITGIQGPLEGAKRRLLRSTFEVTAYPGVHLPEEPIVVSSSGPDTVRAAVATGLRLDTDPRRNVANLSLRVSKGAGVDQAVKPELFQLLPKQLALHGRDGTFQVELPAEQWAALPVGRHKGGRLEVKAPWQDWTAAAAVELVVDKTPCPVSARPVTFDFSAAADQKQTREVVVFLDTRLATRELVWLHTSEKTDGNAPESLVLDPMLNRKGKKIELPALGLGKGVELSGGESPRQERLALTLSRGDEPLPPDRYQTTLWIVGPGVTPAPVQVEVVVDQPKVLVERDGKPVTVSELSLLGLAGTRVQQRLTFQSALNKAVQAVRPSPPPLTRQGGGDLLPPPVVRALGDRVELEVEVPSCVREGWYLSPLAFELDFGQNVLLPLTLPLVLQVTHHGVRPEVAGPLQLEFAEPCAVSAMKEARLVTDSEKAPVRWWAEVLDKPKEGVIGQALEAGRLDVSFKGQSVLDRKGPADSVTAAQPCLVAVTARTSGLAPGLYRATLRLHSYEKAPKEEGIPFDLEVQVVVPGRTGLQVALAEGVRPRVGQEVELRVGLLCYHCEPGAGELWLCDAAGTPAGTPTPLSQRIHAAPDAQLPGLVRYQYAVKFKPSRAGANKVKVTWPALCPEAGGTDGGVSLAVPVAGTLEVSQRFCHRDEEVVVRAIVEPGSVTSGRLAVQAVRRSDPAKRPVSIELNDNGADADTVANDGVWSGKVSFPELGEYDLSLPPGQGAAPRLDPVKVEVGFELRSTVALGGVVHGGNPLLRTLFFLGEGLQVDDALHLVNKRSEPCQWTAQLRFPKTVDDARNILQHDLEVATAERWDPSLHLDTQLAGRAADKELSRNRQQAGSLKDDEAVSLGVNSKLPPDGSLADGAHGMAVEVVLHWTEENGDLSERVLRLPIIVETYPWYYSTQVWLLGALYLVILGVAGWFGARGLRQLLAGLAEARKQPPADDEGKPKTPPVEKPASKPKPPPQTLEPEAKPDYPLVPDDFS